jgi:tetratricopeptide (TPR) repeat protein
MTMDDLRKRDPILDTHLTEEVISADDPRLERTRYKGFQHLFVEPPDLSAFNHLKISASEALNKATRTTNVHEVREYAQLARDLYEQYLTATGNHDLTSDLLFHLGIVNSMLRDFNAAIETLMTALHLDENLIPAKKYLADAFQSSNRHFEACHYYDAYFNDFPRYYGKLVDSEGYMDAGNGQKVKVEFDSILVDITFARGRSYFALGEQCLQTAKEDFKMVVRLDRHHKADALYFLGRAEHLSKDYWKAIKYFDLALQTGPATWFMYHGRSEAYRALGKEERANDDEKAANLLKRQLHWTNKADNNIREPLATFDVKPYLRMYDMQLPTTNEPKSPL